MVTCAPLSMLGGPGGLLEPPSIDNGAYGTEKRLLKTEENEDFLLIFIFYHRHFH